MSGTLKLVRFLRSGAAKSHFLGALAAVQHAPPHHPPLNIRRYEKSIY